MAEEEIQETEKQEETVEEVKNEEEQPKKKSFMDWYNEHPKTVFTIRFILWTLFSAILPFIFIAWRYGIFKSNSGINLSGWGMIGIVILIVFAITLFKYLYKGMKPGLLKQCLGGFVKIVLPLLIILIVIVVVRDNMKIVEQALACVIVCEIVGIPLNPLPDWLEKRRIEQGKEQADTLSDIFWDKFFKKKKDNE